MKLQDNSFHPTWLFNVLACSPLSITFSRILYMSTSSLSWEFAACPGGLGKSFSGFILCICSYQSQVLPPRSLGMPWHLSPCLKSPGSFPTSSIFLPVMIFAIFSPGSFFCPLRSCLLVRDPYFWPSLLSRTLNSGFPFYIVYVQNDSTWSDSQFVVLSRVPLLIGGFKVCHFCLSKCYQNMQPAHSLCSYQVAGFCLRYQKFDFGCSSTRLHTPNYLLPVSDCNLSYSFHVWHLVMIYLHGMLGQLQESFNPWISGAHVLAVVQSNWVPVG